MGSNLCYLCSHASWNIHWDEVSLTGAVPSKKIGFPSVGCYELSVACWLGIRIHEFFIPLSWYVDWLDPVQFLYKQLWVHEFNCPVMTSTSGSSSARWFLNSICFVLEGVCDKDVPSVLSTPLNLSTLTSYECLYLLPSSAQRNILISSGQGHFYMLQSNWKSTVWNQENWVWVWVQRALPGSLSLNKYLDRYIC